MWHHQCLKLLSFWWVFPLRFGIITLKNLFRQISFALTFFKSRIFKEWLFSCRFTARIGMRNKFLLSCVHDCHRIGESWEKSWRNLVKEVFQKIGDICHFDGLLYLGFDRRVLYIEVTCCKHSLGKVVFAFQ